MAKTKLGIHDVLYRFASSKIGYQECAGNEQQFLVNATSFSTTKTITSKDFGNPEFIILMIKCTVATTFTISHSADGVTFFNDPTNNQTFASAGDKIVKLNGANFIQITTSVNQTGACSIVATAIY